MVSAGLSFLWFEEFSIEKKYCVFHEMKAILLKASLEMFYFVWWCWRMLSSISVYVYDSLIYELKWSTWNVFMMKMSQIYAENEIKAIFNRKKHNLFMAFGEDQHAHTHTLLTDTDVNIDYYHSMKITRHSFNPIFAKSIESGICLHRKS